MNRSAVFALVAGLSGVACGSQAPVTSETFAAPSPANFDSVARTLDAHCGTMDCHGSPARNFRMYGYSGRRLDRLDVPGGAPTTPKESGADYCSAIALEPEILAQVTAEGGARPERLTLVRKARGSESHVGNVVFPEGSEGDLCILDWLRGAAQPAHCNNSLTADFDRPPPVPVHVGDVDVSVCNRAVEDQ